MIPISGQLTVLRWANHFPEWFHSWNVQVRSELDPLLLLRTGATEIRTVLEKARLLDDLPGARKAYM
jgi:hypothetical protein